MTLPPFLVRPPPLRRPVSARPPDARDDGPPRGNAYIGSPIERLEDQRLLTGACRFVGDLGSTNLRHAAILRSPVAHGLIRGVDAAAA